jgi:hypothetical protein
VSGEAELQELYDQLPALVCQGLCAESCGPIGASRLEVARVREVAGVDVTRVQPDLTCPALSTTFGAGRCTAYDVRPMLCRLWGVVESMPCPHGCVPQGGHLTEARGHELLTASLRAGGGHDARRLLGQVTQVLGEGRGGL